MARYTRSIAVLRCHQGVTTLSATVADLADLREPAYTAVGLADERARTMPLRGGSRTWLAVRAM